MLSPLHGKIEYTIRSQMTSPLQSPTQSHCNSCSMVLFQNDFIRKPHRVFQFAEYTEILTGIFLQVLTVIK